MAKISIPLHASLLLFVCCLHAPFAPGQEIKPVICHEREFPPESPDRAPHSAASKAADKCIFHENFSFWNCSPDVPLEGLHWLINDELISMEERFSWPLPEGRHVVTLVLDTPFGTFSTTENFVVVDVFPIHAAFDPCPASGAAPLHVDFLNRSSDYPWLFYWWDFGDGQTSTEQNPKHLYEKPGFYTVCLEVAALRDWKALPLKEDTGSVFTDVLPMTYWLSDRNCNWIPASTFSPIGTNAALKHMVQSTFT